ncbi:P-type conjugative transfer protein TrbL [Gluconacetobacter azotocaptans]|uniref:P-type conjugative transfer protein TrbL n=1 Tax=Gluconacetobacter azotocaptans TaxID=142834 RepID=A0A7W4JTX0_9PROT|nr:P-type conjugative transfer protein TrbL [Gluconacetobacter azotocaptans]MBB2190762.1 P-type conjugative transfer protein TrbL [Gluconacetobacter azotocaptans]
MNTDTAVIDHFLDVFSRYIDSGFGLIAGDVHFIVAVLIGVDGTLAALVWALGEEDVLQAFAKKILYVGLFAFFLNNWNHLAGLVFNSFAALGLKATGSTLSYADFLKPGLLAHAGVQGADVLLAQIQRLAGFPNVFWHIGEILVMTLSWVVTLIAFFVLAIMLFLAIIEFKLTTLKGFILVPFALWRGTAFIAEPVLGQVVTSGVRILTYAVVTGIGTQLFTQILPTDPATELSMQDAITILLAAMTIAGLAFSANRIASGIVSGAPQLGLGAAAAPAGVAAGTVMLAATGAGAVAGAAVSGVGAAASLAGGARMAYTLGSAAEGGSVAGGVAGMARAAGGAASGGLRGMAEEAVSALKERYAAGQRGAWTATGGEPTSGMGEDAAGEGLGSSASSPSSQSSDAPPGKSPPAWAERLRGRTVRNAAGRVVREGEGGGAGMKPNLKGDKP